MKSKTVKVSITQRDINKGERYDDVGCPIARALRRKGIKASVGSAGWTTKRTKVIKGWPGKFKEEIQGFIDDFDSGKKVKPFTFELKP